MFLLFTQQEVWRWVDVALAQLLNGATRHLSSVSFLSSTSWCWVVMLVGCKVTIPRPQITRDAGEGGRGKQD